MANFEFTSISNVFKTKDNKQVVKVFQNLGFEETYETENGVFIGSYSQQMLDDSMHVIFDKDDDIVAVYDDYTYENLDEEIIDKLEDEDDKTYCVLSAEEYLQNMLLDGEVVIYKEVGNEKLRYNSAFGLVISKYEIKAFSLDKLIEDYAEQMKK